MAAPNAYTQGIDEVIHVDSESTYGETPTAVPTDGTTAIDHLPGGFSAQTSPLGNTIRADRKSTRSALEHILGKRAGTWSVRKYLMPSGTTAVPDDDLLWTAGLGTSASRLYTFKKNITQSLRLWQFAGNFSRCIIGAVVDRISIEFPDSEPPVVTFSGVCKDIIYTGAGGLLSGTISTANLVVDTDHGQRIAVGSLITVDEDSVTAHRATAVVGDAVTVTPVLTEEISGGGQFYPQQQLTKTVLGSPIPATENAYTHQAISSGWELIAGTVDIVNNHQLRMRERGQVTPTGFSSNLERSLRAKLLFYHKEAQTEFFKNAIDATQRDLVVTLGSQANKKCVIKLNNWVAEPNDPEVGDGDVFVEASGQCIGTAEAEGQVEYTT